jgi:hypothetical protein
MHLIQPPFNTAIKHSHKRLIKHVILYPLKGVIIVLCIVYGLGALLTQPRPTLNNAKRIA